MLYSFKESVKLEVGKMSDWKKNFRRKTAFLTPGWWLIHLVLISLVYTLGHILW